jgi:hypothetical protein
MKIFVSETFPQCLSFPDMTKKKEKAPISSFNSPSHQQMLCEDLHREVR